MAVSERLLARRREPERLRPGVVRRRGLALPRRLVLRSAVLLRGLVLARCPVAARLGGAWLLIPLTVFAVLLPYGRILNYGLMSTFLTPLVVLLIDLLQRIGWALALTLEDELTLSALRMKCAQADWFRIAAKVSMAADTRAASRRGE